MNTKHAKSSCCSAKVIRYGQKRRQCTGCLRTWRIRPKRVGRKRKRSQSDLAIKFLSGARLSSYSIAQNSKASEDMLNRRLRKSLQKFNKETPYPKLPTDKQLIVIADAMVQEIENKRCAVYFILVKSHKSNEAYIAAPYFEEGVESYLGWFNAFDSLPKPVVKNIIAIVSDGHKGLVALAKINGWLMQRCHFHILSHLQGRRSKGRFSRHRQVGEEIFVLARDILTNRCEENIKESMHKLKRIHDESGSPVLKRIIRGFLRNHKQFRTYIDHPDLNLPTTSNSAESMISCVRNLLRRAKGFRTEASLKEWIEGLVKCRKRIKNNGSHQPN